MLLFALLGTVVMAFAQRLPIVGVPELLLVALMGFDVVDDGGGRHQAFPRAENAQRMLSEVSGSGLLPLGRITTPPRRASTCVEVTSLVGHVAMAARMMKWGSGGH